MRIGLDFSRYIYTTKIIERNSFFIKPNEFFFRLKLVSSKLKRCVSVFFRLFFQFFLLLLSSFLSKIFSSVHIYPKESYLSFGNCLRYNIIKMFFIFFLFCHSVVENCRKIQRPPIFSSCQIHSCMVLRLVMNERTNNIFAIYFSFYIERSNKRNQKCKFSRAHAHTCTHQSLIMATIKMINTRRFFSSPNTHRTQIQKNNI